MSLSPTLSSPASSSSPPSSLSPSFTTTQTMSSSDPASSSASLTTPPTESSPPPSTSTTPPPTSSTTTSETTTSDTSTITTSDTTSTTSDTSTTTPPTESTTTPPNSSSSAPETSSSAQSSSSDTSTTSSGPLSTVVSTLVVTDNGQTSTQFISSAIASSTAGAGGASSGDSGGSSNTGAIVGGVVGGVAGLAALVLLVWFCLRRRKRNDFDGDFDPDAVAKRNSSTLQRLGRGGDTDLLAAVRGVENEPEVTPYTYGMQQHGAGGASLYGPATAAGAGAAAGYAAGEYGAHDQKSAVAHPPSSYYDPNAPTMPSGPSEGGSSGHGVSDPRTSMSSSGVPYGASPYQPTTGAGAGAYGMYTPGPVPGANTPSSPTSQSHSTYASSKEREAFAQRYAQQNGQGHNTPYGGAAGAGNEAGIGAGTPVPVPASLQPGGGLGGPAQGPSLTVRNASPIDEGAPGVVVHQDGGRLREEDVEPPNEIPPTYDSIRPDDDPAPTAARQ